MTTNDHHEIALKDIEKCSKYDDGSCLSSPTVTITSRSSTQNSSIWSISKYSKDHRPATIFLISWWTEIAALLMSLCSFIVAIAVIASQNGKPLDTWRFAAPINAVLSTLGTISRSTLAYAISASIGQQKWNWFLKRKDRLSTFTRFDEASRGPLGSIKLIWQVRKL
jgi:hypothetical protein